LTERNERLFEDYQNLKSATADRSINSIYRFLAAAFGVSIMRVRRIIHAEHKRRERGVPRTERDIPKPRNDPRRKNEYNPRSRHGGPRGVTR